ncbi:MAG: hypothetical protein AAF982_06600 [Pseudomonadota bacterium]
MAQIAHRYALNADMLHIWHKDPCLAPPEDDDAEAPFMEVALGASVLPVAVDAAGEASADLLSAPRGGYLALGWPSRSDRRTNISSGRRWAGSRSDT